MSKLKETLKSYLLGKNIEFRKIEGYLDGISDEAAGNLLDLLTSTSTDSSKNSGDGDGGFLTGLRKIVESVKADEELVLPEKPRGMAPEEKSKYIEEFDKGVKENNNKFADGLRMILKSKSNIRASKLSQWQYELSDPDFPKVVAENSKENFKSLNKLSKKVKKKLDKEQENIKEILKKHKDNL